MNRHTNLWANKRKDRLFSVSLIKDVCVIGASIIEEFFAFSSFTEL
jgi:hypothetical protein